MAVNTIDSPTTIHLRLSSINLVHQLKRKNLFGRIRDSLFLLGFYDLLGLESDCNDGDLKKQWRKAIIICHPDKGGDSEIFRRVNRANEVLKNHRAEYDQLGGIDLETLIMCKCASCKEWN